MGGRTKPNWAVFEGGPKDGVRTVLPPTVGPGPYEVYTKGTTPGMVTVHEYLVTADYRKGAFNEANARVVTYVRTLPDERPAPPPPPYVAMMSAWRILKGEGAPPPPPHS